MTDQEFEEIWRRPNKNYLSYPSYYPLIRKTLKILIPVLKLVMPIKPKMFFEMEARHEKTK